MAAENFEQSNEGTKVTMAPQCTECRKNKNIISCGAFDVKPEEYRTNRLLCPEWVTG